jgi:hypothetical protein
LKVTKVEGDRFWAEFEMKATLRAGINQEPDPARSVTITGTVENAFSLCPEGAGEE